MREISTAEIDMVSGGSDLDLIADGISHLSLDGQSSGPCVYIHADTDFALQNYIKAIENSRASYPNWIFVSTVDSTVPHNTVTAVGAVTDTRTGTVKTTKPFSFSNPTRPGTQPSY